ncbi:hypothetical protein BJ508DRAFT_302177 [Ascobolus immersus RN42]|uniref:Uncharacterized protein n=1 Tax=Ascobolus immersus RN42 TaxID=1160509 RepID=A0A3N4IJF6_ASCIM|nr:hypothetical protein BJ508DRAFT_302177 [Ascobolus immersus RN42]
MPRFRRSRELRKRSAAHEVAPFITLTKHLNTSQIDYALWGSVGLLLGMLIDPQWEFTEVDYVIADYHLPKACQLLKALGYIRDHNGKTGIYGFFIPVGKLPQIRRFHGPPSTNPDACLPVNLLPASLVCLRMQQRGYMMSRPVKGPDGVAWNVRLASLPGMMDAVLSLMDKHAKNETQREIPHFALPNRQVSYYKALPVEEVRNQMLYFHGKNMWVEVMDTTLKREDTGGRYPLGDVPERLRTLAGLLRPRMGRYLIELICIADPYEDDSDSAESRTTVDGEERWEEAFGVAGIQGGS